MRIIKSNHTQQQDINLSMPENPKMKCVRRESVIQNFEVSSANPVPDVPEGGARVKVHFAGACYTNAQFQKTGKRRPKLAGIQDTSLFPGYEISGKIDALCNTVTDHKFKTGDKVIVYPEDEEVKDNGYADYVVVKDVRNLIKIPDTLSLQVAAMLPTGALTALNTIMRTRPLLYDKAKRKNAPVNILIVGAGGLGLWTTVLAKYICMAGDDNVCLRSNIIVADSNIEKLVVAKDHGCSKVVHWNEMIYEDYLIDRTKNVCDGGVDMVVDYCSSPRTINRSLKVLAEDGILVVGGNSRYEVSVCLHSLAVHQHTIMGIGKGSREQLQELVELIASEKVKPPMYQIFPVDKATEVFGQLNECKITGRAVLQINTEDDDLI